MSKNEDAVVNEWLTMFKIATDADSPFCGMIDLSGIFKLPLQLQKRIYDAMTPEARERLAEVYGEKGGAA